jgi:hypothetical protein
MSQLSETSTTGCLHIQRCCKKNSDHTIQYTETNTTDYIGIQTTSLPCAEICTVKDFTAIQRCQSLKIESRGKS